MKSPQTLNDSMENIELPNSPNNLPTGVDDASAKEKALASTASVDLSLGNNNDIKFNIAEYERKFQPTQNTNDKVNQNANTSKSVAKSKRRGGCSIM